MPFRLGNRPFARLSAIALLLVSAIGSPADGASREDAYRAEILPMLEQYCIDCHAEVYAEGGIILDRFADREAAVGDAETWLRVLDAVEGRLMPPADMPQPTVEELEAVVSWIERDVIASRAGSAAPPPVVLRRLNRQEYDNTIRDLIGLDLGLSASFPQDEIGFGFDNVGSALNVSPIHVEKYLDAAERALDAAIVAPSVEGLAPAELIGLRTYPLPLGGSVEFEHALKPGRYLADFSLVRVRVAESVPPPRLVIGFGSDRRTVEAARVQDETVVYRYWLNVAEGDDTVHVSVAPGQSEAEVLGTEAITALDGGDQRYGDDRGLHVDSMVVRGPAPDGAGGLPESHRRILFVDPGPGDEGRIEAARRVIERFSTRAFRRPADPDEVEGILDLFRLAHDRGESFERSVQVALSSVLVSPRFLYLVEPDEAEGDRPLDDFELASRLSYFLWSSMPDDEMSRLARDGTLRSDLRRQVDRMLDDPRADAFVSNFVGQWLQLRKLDGVARDESLFPGFDDELRDAMRRETELFFADLLRENRSALELLDSDHTFVNEELARHYGIDGVSGGEFRRVSLEGRPRGGVLTQASVLTLTSNPNRTSPVKRGQWILQQILGTPPPPPPPDVPELGEGNEAAEAASLRERLELHRSNPECASCHSQMDPLGFALENFDAIGRWRDSDGDSPIDPSGELAGGLAFDDAEGLRRILVESSAKKFSRTLVEHLMTYALGRGLVPDDYPTVEAVRERLVEDDHRIRSILYGIVESDNFQRRGIAEGT